MPPVAIVTIIGAALTVLVLAAYLIGVALVLRRIDARLRAVNGDLQSVTDKTEPVGSIVGEINGDLSKADGALKSVVGR